MILGRKSGSFGGFTRARGASPAGGPTSAAVLLIAGIGLAIPAAALAQGAPAASRVAPATLAPLRAEPDSSITLPDQPAAGTPPGARELSVTLGGVTVDGADTAVPAGAAQAITDARALAGKRILVADLYAAAQRIEAAYAEAGMVLTRVTLPPQHLSDGGAVRILVVAGYIESVEVSALPKAVREPVRRRLAALIGAKGLTLAAIERHILLAGDVPGVRLRSTLLRGDAPGAVRLVLNGQYRAISGGISADNNLGAPYQYEAFTIQLALNSVLGLGEQIYGQATSGPDLGQLFSADSRRRVLGGGVVLPIGNSGFTLNPEFTKVDTNPRVGNTGVQTTGLYERFALRGSYPLVRTRRETLVLTGGIEAIREVQSARAFNLTLSKDVLRIISADVSYARSIGSDFRLTADGGLDFGIAGLGARSGADAAASGIPLSRLGAQPDFSKATLRLRGDQHFGAGLDLAVTVRGQASFTGALPAAAEFSLDGAESLSSFAQGSFNADSGLTGRVELARPFAVARKPAAVATPYVFGALGYGHLSRPTALELANLHSWSLGGGLRMLLSDLQSGIASYASVEVSHGHVTSLAQDPTRVSASISIRF